MRAWEGVALHQEHVFHAEHNGAEQPPAAGPLASISKQGQCTGRTGMHRRKGWGAPVIQSTMEPSSLQPLEPSRPP